jgi:hypothetical protein
LIPFIGGKPLSTFLENTFFNSCNRETSILGIEGSSLLVLKYAYKYKSTNIDWLV